jgi:hypothetical protein
MLVVTLVEGKASHKAAIRDKLWSVQGQRCGLVCGVMIAGIMTIGTLLFCN